MAENTKQQYLDLTGLQSYDTKSVNRMTTAINAAKTEAIESAANAFRFASVKDNSIEFYSTNPVEEGTAPVVTVDLPTELYLDQTKTTFVTNFAFSDELYPGATNPNMDGEPVVVLAVKGSDDSVTYSFMNMKQLVDIYTGGTTTTATVSIDNTTNVVTAEVKVSGAEGNLLVELQELIGEIPEDATATTVVGYAKELVDAAQQDIQALELIVGAGYEAIPEDAIAAMFE